MAESEIQAPQQKVCALSMDEMKIKSGLVFSKSIANSNIERLVADPESSQPQLADEMLVLMARAVFKPSLSVPVAHYPSRNLSGKLAITCV